MSNDVDTSHLSPVDAQVRVLRTRNPRKQLPMHTKTPSARVLLVIAAIAAFTLAAACTPEQIAAVKRHQEWVLSQDKYYYSLSEQALHRLRACESGGNYRIVSANGLYRGAYQFHRTTWNSVAAQHYPHLRGVDPAAAAPADQDRMARALFHMQGRSPWPICGKRI